MNGRSLSLDGVDWEVKGYLGLDGAEVAARKAWDETTGWLPATVPGSVTHDLWRAGEIPDPYVERNSLAIEWVPERAWLYRRRFTADDALADPLVRAWLRFAGVDHGAQVHLDGEPLRRHEGMFVPFEIDLTRRLRPGANHALAVIVEPAPDTEPQTGRTSRVRVHKSRMTYGWDFCPRMVHQGIWQAVTIELAGTVRIRDLWARPELPEDGRRVRVAIEVELDLAAGGPVDLVAELAGLPGGPTAAATVEVAAGRSLATLALDVDDPPLWWPNGHGPAPVGRVVVRARTADGSLDRREVPIGFRRVELAENDGAPDSAGPYTFVVNGRRIYAKGWNWVPHDVFHGVSRPDRIEHLVRLLADAGVNLVRVWGGGLIETPAFYDACDRRGIMVWQEFIQSSSGIEDTPSSDPGFVELMRAEAEAIVPLRRNHPSLVLWCGGNELRDERGTIDDDAPVVGALHDVVRRLDPDRAWLPTSPTGPQSHNRLESIASDPDGLHDVHGPWEHQGLTGQHELYDRGTSLLNSEFGVEGMTNRRSHEALLSAAHRWPADRSNPIYRHLGEWWINEPLVQAAFGGRLTDLETLRRASQHLQADGLRYAIEANRRRAYRNSGSIPWQFNEPYPFAWSTCAVDHRGDPKPAYFAVRRAYAPILVGAAFAGAVLDGKAAFTASIWAWSERAPLADARVSATLVGADGTCLAEATWPADLSTLEPVRPGVFEAPFGTGLPDLVLLDLRLVDGGGAMRATNRYTFSGTADLAPLLDVARAELDVTVDRKGDAWRLRVRHAGGPVAFGISILDDRPIGDPGWAEIEDSGFDLLPGEARDVAVQWTDAPAAGRCLAIGGWNVGPIAVD